LITALSGDWYPGRLTQAKATFQDKGGLIGLQLGRAGQTYGRFPLSNQPYRLPAVGPGATGPPSHHQDSQPTGLQLGRDRHRHGRLPRAIDLAESRQSAQAQSAHLTIRGKLTQDHSNKQVRSHQCAIPRDRGGREAKSLQRSGRDALSTSPPIPRTGRQDRTSYIHCSSSCPMSLQHGPPLVGSGSPGEVQSMGPSRLEDDSWAQSAVKLPIYPGLTL